LPGSPGKIPEALRSIRYHASREGTALEQEPILVIDDKPALLAARVDKPFVPGQIHASVREALRRARVGRSAAAQD
jgi:hypothetical protein